MQILIIGACPVLSACLGVLYEEAGGAEVLHPKQRNIERLDVSFDQHLIELTRLDPGVIDCISISDHRNDFPTLRQPWPDHRWPQHSAQVRNWNIDRQIRGRA